MSLASPLAWLADLPLVRRSADAGFRAYARRRVRTLERTSVVATQQATLLRLVRHAARTCFGRDHDFAGIRCVADYHARVPLRDYDAFWKDYWQPQFPQLQNATWPDALPYLALSSGTTTGATKYIPISRPMLASNRKAALTSLSWFHAAHPGCELFTGRMFFLGGSTDLQPAVNDPNGPLAGDLSGIAAREVSAFLRPFTYPSLDVALRRDWEVKLSRLAEESARLPITLISGVPSWLLVLFERLKQVTGRSTIADIWPTLRVVVHGGTSFGPYRSLFQQVIGNERVRFLETYPASEGFVAAEDPRYQLLRVIPDHGIFHEFVPVDELGGERPTRHTLADIVPGVQYAVVLTTCAGLWSYVLGDTVSFERRDPPLLRFTGRTRYFLSAFGEHLICEEVERAIAQAAETCGAAVADFHVGPVFPDSARAPGRHRYLVEFVQAPRDLERYGRELDAALCRINEDYQAHRAGDLTMRAPEVWGVARGGFADWMRAHGKLGGQHKLPRMDNTGRLTASMSDWLRLHHHLAGSSPANERALLDGIPG
ncbi:MAG: GH3 auxin-responsive promoter family protein [Planctomycetia bacterium]|nr:GH3 auxin-responsive promoter family protein [Planctomycetia bacterium]